jgi:uncharacterized protein (TIGR03083 family)
MTLDFVAHLADNSDRFLAALRDADPGLPVPSCPEWAADDLLWHLGEVQWFWGTIVRERVQDPETVEEPSRPRDHAGLVDFFGSATERLQSALAGTDPTTPVYMWADDKTVGYVRRRQAHEALIHRLDAELTVGAVTPLDTSLASDGVDEALTHFFGGVPEWGTFSPDGRHLAVATTDTGLLVPLALGQWSGTSPNTGREYDEPAIEVVPAAPSPAATVRAPAADLDAWLWGRADESVLAVSGDPTAFAHLRELVSQGVE